MINRLLFFCVISSMLILACTNKNNTTSSQAILGDEIATNKTVAPITTENSSPIAPTAVINHTTTENSSPAPTVLSKTLISFCPQDNNLCRYKELKSATPAHILNYPLEVKYQICVNKNIAMHIVLESKKHQQTSTLACELVSYDVQSNDGVTIDFNASTIKQFILPSFQHARINDIVDLTKDTTRTMPGCKKSEHNIIYCTHQNRQVMLLQSPPFYLNSRLKAFHEHNHEFCHLKQEEHTRILQSNGYTCTVYLNTAP